MLDSLVRVSRRVGPLQLQPRSWHAQHPEVQGAAKPRPRARWAAAVPEGGGAPAGGARDDRVTGVLARSAVRSTRVVRLLPTISRTISLSFQSSFHLSLTVLVRYRSLANI